MPGCFHGKGPYCKNTEQIECHFLKFFCVLFNLNFPGERKKIQKRAVSMEMVRTVKILDKLNFTFYKLFVFYST